MSIKKVGTHNGTFHGDEVIAYVILKEVFGELNLVRSRKEEALNQCEIVFDVGGGKYDHHTNNKKYREKGVPYAAAGLIWNDFGKKLIHKKGVTDEGDAQKIFEYIDKNFIQAMDAVDNGMSYNSDFPVPDLAKMISQFNPSWDSSDTEEEQFLKACDFARIAFTNQLEAQLSVFNAKKLVIDAMNNREHNNILFLGSSCPWKQNVLDLDVEKEIEFVIFPDLYEGYRIQVVPKKLDSFEARKDLPMEWAGQSVDKLNEIIGINDAVFAHPGRFIAGAESKESIIKMASLASKN